MAFSGSDRHFSLASFAADCCWIDTQLFFHKTWVPLTLVAKILATGNPRRSRAIAWSKGYFCCHHWLAEIVKYLAIIGKLSKK